MQHGENHVRVIKLGRYVMVDLGGKHVTFHSLNVHIKILNFVPIITTSIVSLGHLWFQFVSTMIELGTWNLYSQIAGLTLQVKRFAALYHLRWLVMSLPAAEIVVVFGQDWSYRVRN